MTTASFLPRPIALVYAGGTIGAVGTPLAPLSGDAFRARWRAAVDPRLDTGPVAWTCLDPAIDSTDATPADWLRLARAVVAAAANGAGGVVVLHGTDTMANSAAALAFLTAAPAPDGTMAPLACPVVLTGAQRPMFDQRGVAADTDALANVAAALQSVGDGPGVRIAFGGRRIAGTRAVKLSSTADAAFEDPAASDLSRTEQGGRAQTAVATIRSVASAPSPDAIADRLDALADRLGRRAVLVVTPAPEGDGLLADALAGAAERLGSRLGAVILAGYGLGNVPGGAAMEGVVAGLASAGVPVVVTTQSVAGGACPDLYAAGAWAARCGAFSAGSMTLPALHAKLHIALALTGDAAAVRRFVLSPIAGEFGEAPA